MTPGPLPPEEAEASLEPSPAPEGSLEGVPDPEGGRRAAPVLSLEARKAQRQRDREAARAARIASFIAGEEDGPDRSSRPGAKAEARAARQEGHERRDQRTEELDEARAPSAAPAPPARGAAQAAGTTRRLRGVRPDEGLAAEGRRPWAPAGAAVGSALARGTTPGRRAPLAPPEVPPPAAEPGAGTAAARRPAVAAQPRARHWLVAASFALVVLLPTVLAAWYLWTRAAPRYASYAGFSVRTEDTDSAMGILGGMAALAGASSSSDTDILYEFIRSQEIVARVDARLDLEVLWAKGDPARDPVFTYHAPGTIEDLHLHWNRMVEVYNDGSTGLLDIEVQAFTAEDAEAIAQAIVDESSTLVNRLSDIAQEDATRYAAEELAIAEERLKEARTAMTRFRNETQIVDPATAVASQMGLLSELEGQLAQTLIDLDLLRLTAPEGDPRIAQVEARQGVIEERMAAERAKLGLGPSGLPTVPGAAGEEAFADLVGQYEGLAVDQEFASQAYAAARTAYDAAVAESRRQSRYLAAHVQPTLAQRAEYPARITLTSLTFVFALLAWMIVTLAAYALRDRR
jgi:capsular polysaccharide transport system permease protein